jgi:hypothetical protein
MNFWLEVSMYLECPPSCHVDTGIPDFALFKQALRWFPCSKLVLQDFQAVLHVSVS